MSGHELPDWGDELGGQLKIFRFESLGDIVGAEDRGARRELKYSNSVAVASWGSRGKSTASQFRKSGSDRDSTSRS